LASRLVMGDHWSCILSSRISSTAIIKPFFSACRAGPGAPLSI